MKKPSKKRYYKDKVKRFYIEFYIKDSDIMEHLSLQRSKQGYIKSLIREDMKKGTAQSVE